MALKLDMNKAYNRVEWDFLRLIMLKMEFPVCWVDRVMLCVSTVCYSFLVNGQPTHPIIPQRGLRQGDPISPYLFLLCAEGLGGLLQKAHDDGKLHGIAVNRGAPLISHLFFADDCILFARANLREAACLKSIFQTYESLSGQKINIAKSAVSFSKGLGGDVRDSVQAYLAKRKSSFMTNIWVCPPFFIVLKRFLFPVFVIVKGSPVS